MLEVKATTSLRQLFVAFGAPFSFVSFAVYVDESAVPTKHALKPHVVSLNVMSKLKAPIAAELLAVKVNSM